MDGHAGIAACWDVIMETGGLELLEGYTHMKFE